MAIYNEIVSVNSTPVAIGADEDENQVFGGRSLVLQNGGTVAIGLGGESVTMETAGYVLSPDTGVSIDLHTDDTLYAVSATPTTLRVLKMGY